MTGRISQGGLLVILAFLVPVIVELRTVAGLLGIRLSTIEYVGVSATLVLAVLVAVFVWNDHVDRRSTDDHSEGI